MSRPVTYAEHADQVTAWITSGDLDAAAAGLVAARRAGGGAGLRPLLEPVAALPRPQLTALVRALLRQRRAHGGWPVDSVLGAVCPLLPPDLPPDLVAELLTFAVDSSYDLPVMTLAGLVAQQLRHGALPPAVLALMERRKRESLWLRELAASAAARAVR
ncbi:hypothetical protein CS0771_35860 [Catellatospora sp. IY07-71]|uniref:hypothetical protein n=1 Tax=Catellatospora sp. IY07-71 TaxID=2728827 RepID=UPI001BB35459|nr:hypothetical protein [Catellatospora sp. IY07-71]BCJ74042.1 hypothetical protein CS0771_35860 [Catellatospora sp. IY07-71]